MLAGIVVGRVLAYVAFRSSSRVAARGRTRGVPPGPRRPRLVVRRRRAGLGGYGFLSVFVCAMTFRSAERSHDYHAAMHEVAERLERLLTLFVLLVLGIALTRGLLDALDWRGVGLGLALIFLIRPAAGVLSLEPWARSSEHTGGLTRPQRWAAAFFGVRGVGSLYS